MNLEQIKGLMVDAMEQLDGLLTQALEKQDDDEYHKISAALTCLENAILELE